MRFAVEDQADIGGGAAHVEADGTLDPECAGHAARCSDAGSRARGGEAERQVAQGRGRCHAAGGMEEVQAGFLRLCPLQIVHVRRRQRHDSGAECRRRRPFVLAGLGIDPVRERDVGDPCAQALAQRLLVGRVGVGMEQRHGNRLRTTRCDARDRVFDRRRVQRDQDPAVVVEPLGHLEAAFGGHLGRELGRQVEPVEVAPVLAPDRERVRKAARGDQGDIGMVALDDGIGDDGRAVDQIVHVRPCEIDRAECCHQSDDAIVGAGGNLRGSHLATRPVHGDHVRKRTADIDTDLPSIRHGAASGCRAFRLPVDGLSTQPKLMVIGNYFDNSITMRRCRTACQYEFGPRRPSIDGVCRDRGV